MNLECYSYDIDVNLAADVYIYIFESIFLCAVVLIIFYICKKFTPKFWILRSEILLFGVPIILV